MPKRLGVGQLARFQVTAAAASALLLQRGCDAVCAPSSSSPIRKTRYVVVGSEGVAGKAAMATLREHGARERELYGIDPKSLDFESRHCVESLDCSQKKLTLSDGTVVSFEQVLIATGRSIPRSGDRNRRGENAARLGELEGIIDPVLFPRKHAVFIDDPFVVEGLAKKVSRGEHVTILGGSTMDTKVIEVALKLASEGRRSGFDNVVSIVCPSSGVMSQQLPRYLSMALNRRLNTLGVEVIRYAQVRYVAGIDAIVPVEPGEEEEEDEDDDDEAAQSGRNKYGKVALFCSNTYDSLNTTSFESDTVALVGTSPRVGGDNKSKAVHFGLKAGLESGTVGGIVCNRSLQAAAGVWLAGDVANLDLGRGGSGLGRGCWSGKEHAEETGRVAALNMLGGSHLYGSIPADHLVCPAEPFVSGSDSTGENDTSSSASRARARVSSRIEEVKARVGAGAGKGEDNLMSFCFVGHCSAALDSYGFWWGRRTTPGLLPGAGVSAGAGANEFKEAATRSTDKTESGSTGGTGGAGEAEAEKDKEKKESGRGIAGVVQEQFLGYFGLSSREGREVPDDTMAPMAARGRGAVARVLPTGTNTEITGTASSSSGRAARGTRGSSSQRERQRQGQRSGAGTEGPRTVKRLPRVPPLGAGLVMYLGPNGTITGVLLAGLAPSHTCSSSSEAARAYRALQEQVRGLIGTKVNPYFEEATPSSSSSSSSSTSEPLQQQQQQQAVFLFGNPGGAGRYVSVSSQLETIASDALRRYDARLQPRLSLTSSRSRAADASARPNCRTVKGSLELQRSVTALMADARGSRVTPVPALREKLASGMTHSSNKDRIAAAYSTAMKNNEIKATWSGPAK